MIEVLPKEKKAREEKTAPIGQGVLDLSSLLKGKTNINNLLVVLYFSICCEILNLHHLKTSLSKLTGTHSLSCKLLALNLNHIFSYFITVPVISGENGFSQWVVIHSGTTAETVAANTGQNILQVCVPVMQTICFV